MAVEDIVGMGFVTPMSWSNLERHGSLILKLHMIGFSLKRSPFSRWKSGVIVRVRPRDANRALVRRGGERARRRLVDHFRSVVIRRNYRYRDA